jgi:hypothetical protein
VDTGSAAAFVTVSDFVVVFVAVLSGFTVTCDTLVSFPIFVFGALALVVASILDVVFSSSFSDEGTSGVP